MKPGVFREEYIAIIVRELLKGLDYLHMEGKLHRDIKGEPFMILDRLGLIDLKLVMTHFSCKYFAISDGRCEAGRLWGIRSALWNFVSKEEYLCWDTVLDVPRSYQTVRLRLQGRHLEPWDYCNRVGEKRTALC